MMEYKCDRCNEYSRDYEIYFKLNGQEFHLCKECTKKLFVWMEKPMPIDYFNRGGFI